MIILSQSSSNDICRKKCITSIDHQLAKGWPMRFLPYNNKYMYNVQVGILRNFQFALRIIKPLTIRAKNTQLLFHCELDSSSTNVHSWLQAATNAIVFCFIKYKVKVQYALKHVTVPFLQFHAVSLLQYVSRGDLVFRHSVSHFGFFLSHCVKNNAALCYQSGEIKNIYFLNQKSNPHTHTTDRPTQVILKLI